MKGLIKAKENSQYTNVRVTHHDLVLMEVGINNIEQVVHNVLTIFSNMHTECLHKATFTRLMYTES